MSLVYFVAKKDRTQRIVQDYQYINQWMIKIDIYYFLSQIYWIE